MTRAGRSSPRTSRAELTDACITCGDAASWMRVVDVDARAQTARCADSGGRTEVVLTELVGAVAPDDTLLVHAGTAIRRESPALPARQAEAGR